jgi:hypothetical protein
MRLVRRLTLYLLLVVGVVFGIDTYLSVRSHLVLFDEDSRRDEKELGDALVPAVEQAWRARGEAGAVVLLRAMDSGARDVRIRLVYLDAERGAPFGPEAPNQALEAVRRDRTLTYVRAENEPEAHLYTYVPLNVPGDRPAALELSESLAHERAYASQRIRGTLLTGALALLVSGAVAWIVGARVVGQPVSALVAKARRIGSGDFSGPLSLRQRDELSAVDVALTAALRAAQRFNATSNHRARAAKNQCSCSSYRTLAGPRQTAPRRPNLAAADRPPGHVAVALAQQFLADLPAGTRCGSGALAVTRRRIAGGREQCRSHWRSRQYWAALLPMS